MGRRTLLLITSLLIAAIGTALVALYVRGADSRALAGQKLVSVLVANQFIQTGTPSKELAGTGKAFTLKDIPLQYKVEGAIGSQDPLKDLVAAGNIFPNQQITLAMFKKPGADNISGVSKEKLAVQLTVAEAARAGSFLAVGNSVVVFWTHPGSKGGPVTARLFPEPVSVIGIGGVNRAQASAAGAPSAVNSPLITVELTPQQAAQALEAQTVGSLYFALPGEGATLAGVTPVTADDLVTK